MFLPFRRDHRAGGEVVILKGPSLIAFLQTLNLMRSLKFCADNG
jgi:hypothetical protein